MNKETQRYTKWGALGSLMQKNKLFAIAVQLSIYGSFVFLFLSLITRFGVFIWLMDISLITLAAAGTVAMAFNLITYLRQRKEGS